MATVQIPTTESEIAEYLRTMACVAPDTGYRRLPNYVDDEVFDRAAAQIEWLRAELDATKKAEIKALEGTIKTVSENILLRDQLSAALAAPASAEPDNLAPLTRMPDREWEAFHEAYEDELDLRPREGNEAMYRALLVAINMHRQGLHAPPRTALSRSIIESYSLRYSNETRLEIPEMAITYEDRLRDAGYFDITPEQEREIEAREECERRGIDPDEICADGGVTAWMVVDQQMRHAADVTSRILSACNEMEVMLAQEAANHSAQNDERQADRCRYAANEFKDFAERMRALAAPASADEPVKVKTCGNDNPSSRDCSNMREVGGGMDGERYRCAVCGKSYFLDYEDMK